MNKIRGSKYVSVIILILGILLFFGCTDKNLSEEDVHNSFNNNSVEIMDLEDKLIIHFIDVGQADSILIQMPNGEVSLIDGGNRADGEMVVQYLKEQSINRIDYLIATHPHEDHIGGLPDVIREFNIGQVYMPKVSANTKIFENLLVEVKNKDLKVITAKGGQRIIKTDDIEFDIIAPNSDDYKETNEYSIVNKLTYKNNSFIFTGDAEKHSEDEMINKGYDLSADVLKIGHHGGRSSTNEDFLNKARPKYAIISVGKDNDYGHPHKEVLDRLKSLNINILRTDEIGTIMLISDGDNITFNNNAELYLEEKSDISTDLNEKNTIYIGNKTSKIYHLSTANHLPKKENQIIFNSKEEAEKNGYKPCKKCNP